MAKRSIPTSEHISVVLNLLFDNLRPGQCAFSRLELDYERNARTIQQSNTKILDHSYKSFTDIVTRLNTCIFTHNYTVVFRKANFRGIFLHNSLTIRALRVSRRDCGVVHWCEDSAKSFAKIRAQRPNCDFRQFRVHIKYNNNIRTNMLCLSSCLALVESSRKSLVDLLLRQEMRSSKTNTRTESDSADTRRQCSVFYCYFCCRRVDPLRENAI